MSASALPREIRSSELSVEINRKPEKNIPDIINCNLNKDYQILIIFGRNCFDTTGYLKNALVFTSPNVCFCTTYGKQTKHNTC